MERRVVVTGMGAITPVGNTVEEFWSNIKDGVVGIDCITKFDTENFKAKLAAEVKNFDAELYMPKKDLKRMDMYCAYAIAAAVQAVKDSGLAIESVDPNGFGVMVGSGIGGMETIQEQVTRLREGGPKRVAPLFIPSTLANMAAGNIAIRFGARGPCSAAVTACASSTNSIGDAFRTIKHGYAEVMLAGGAEAAITEIGVAGFINLTALSLSEDPKRASIPFDKERNGFVMGEGAGILVLEELSRAEARGAKIYAEIVGYGSTCDAYHMTSPMPGGESAAAAMENAIREAGIPKEDVGYINAHGTSTEPNDIAETLAIKKVFGDLAYQLCVSSTKSMTGHLLGAAGAVEAIATIMALVKGVVPPTAGYQVPDEECDLNYVPNKAVQKDIKCALSNSFGFGGHNAVLAIQKWG